jgi:hypothetical protein
MARANFGGAMGSAMRLRPSRTSRFGLERPRSRPVSIPLAETTLLSRPHQRNPKATRRAGPLTGLTVSVTRLLALVRRNALRLLRPTGYIRGDGAKPGRDGARRADSLRTGNLTGNFSGIFRRSGILAGNSASFTRGGPGGGTAATPAAAERTGPAARSRVQRRRFPAAARGPAPPSPPRRWRRSRFHRPRLPPRP